MVGLDGNTYGCFGCSGTGSAAQASIDSAKEYAEFKDILRSAEYVMGDFRRIPVPPGVNLISFLQSQGIVIREINIPPTTFAHIRAVHGWFSISPGVKSRFFNHITGSSISMDAFMNGMVNGTSVVPGGYSMRYNRIVEFGVRVEFSCPVGMTGYYRGNLLRPTSAARFDFALVGSSGVMTSGYPVP